MTRLALLRHGHTAWNRAHRIQGLTDVPLDPEAEAHLRDLCLPEPWEHATLVSSPLARAMQTGQILTGKAPHIEPALIEMDWGAWEGQHGAKLRADPASGFRDIEEWGWEWHPPGGESPATLRARLRPWAEALRGDTLAVCHIGVMRVLMAIATGWDFAGTAPFKIKRDRLYIIEIENSCWSARPTPLALERR